MSEDLREEIPAIVSWLRQGSMWLNGGECCGEKCSDGVCAAPACLWGEELKLLHRVADLIERGPPYPVAPTNAPRKPSAGHPPR